jgi:hypothetical protein
MNEINKTHVHYVKPISNSSLFNILGIVDCETITILFTNNNVSIFYSKLSAFAYVFIYLFILSVNLIVGIYS